jgi:hypothetical protein
LDSPGQGVGDDMQDLIISATARVGAESIRPTPGFAIN